MYITLCMLCNKWEEKSRKVLREAEEPCRRFHLPFCLIISVVLRSQSHAFISLIAVQQFTS